MSRRIIDKIQVSYIHFRPSKLFSSLLKISSKNYIFLKTFNPEFQGIEVWFPDQYCHPLEIKDRINLTLVIK